MIFHALNRGNAWDRIFDDDADYEAFEFYAHGKSHDPQRLGHASEPSLEKKEREAVQASVIRGHPFGSESWQETTAKHLGLESPFRTRGLP